MSFPEPFARPIFFQLPLGNEDNEPTGSVSTALVLSIQGEVMERTGVRLGASGRLTFFHSLVSF